jgi:hypothetical protein
MAYYNHWGQPTKQQIVEICNNGRPETMLRIKTTHPLYNVKAFENFTRHPLKNVKTFEKTIIVLGGKVTR